MIIRILVLLLALWLAIKLVQRIRAGKASSGPRIGKGDMVRCHGCGLYIPKGEAIDENGRYYCCPEHQQSDHGPEPP